MNWQQELIVRARQAAAHPAVRELRVTGSAVEPSSLDEWSDVDLALLLDPERPTPDLLVRFGRPWARTRHHDGALAVERVVYDDGRWLDLVSTNVASAMPTGRLLDVVAEHVAVDAPETGPRTDPQPEARPEVMAVRFAAALAVVRLARSDLLIGMHLGLEVVASCLVLAMRLRDRDVGTTSHRFGGPRNEVVGRLESSCRHPWTAAGGMSLVREATRVYDDLAVELDPGYVADWSGLDALLRQAGRVP